MKTYFPFTFSKEEVDWLRGSEVTSVEETEMDSGDGVVFVGLVNEEGDEMGLAFGPDGVYFYNSRWPKKDDCRVIALDAKRK